MFHEPVFSFSSAGILVFSFSVTFAFLSSLRVSRQQRAVERGSQWRRQETRKEVQDSSASSLEEGCLSGVERQVP